MSYHTAERVSHLDTSDNYVLQRSIKAYVETAEIISGKVLEIGTGSGYGIEIVAPKATEYITIDKFNSEHPGIMKNDNVSFIQMEIPPFKDMEDNQFDFVISFQVIEHIKKDSYYVSEIYRVLKPGGKFIVTTPNIKTTLSRNPWHIREYTVKELETLLLKSFDKLDKKGVYGNEKVMDYYNKNKESVDRIMKWDIFNLQYLLPRQILQIPYDILNRRNRKKLLSQNNKLTMDIKQDDYFIAEAKDNCLDLFFIAEKKR